MAKIEIKNSVPAQRRKKGVSKKKKSAWRKHSKTKDVEEFLDELRHEERVGRIHIHSAKDDQLFYVDTDFKVSGAKQPVTRIERTLKAKRKLEGIPRCFEALENKSPVPDPIKRNRVRTSEEKKRPLHKRIEAGCRSSGLLKAKDKMIIKNRNVHKEQKQRITNVEEFKDLWEEEEHMDMQWVNPVSVRFILHGRRKKKVPATITQKTSMLPAIETPHPGISYNPSFADHKALLENIAEEEMENIKKTNHLTRVTSEMFSVMTVKEREHTYMEEMMQGMPQSGEIAVKEEDEDLHYKTVNSPSKDKKKTRKQRRNLRLTKEEEHQKQKKAIEKKKVADIYKLKKIVDSMDKDDVKKLESQRIKMEKREMKELEVKCLSAVKYEAPEPDFNMPCDLSGNLRGLKVEGNILKDCFKSMQRRNMLQPTVIRKVKKAKKKVFVANTHK